MAIDLAATDIAVLKALLKDGRKSFRQISRETGISGPTVKTKFNRLVNMGIIIYFTDVRSRQIIIFEKGQERGWYTTLYSDRS